MRRQPGWTIRSDPLAYFLTWTTYGSWLPGDGRGWVDRRGAIREPNSAVWRAAAHRMVSDAVVLMPHQRRVVDECVACHARRRGWTLHAVQCRSQHVHAVVTAPGRAPAAVIVELKVWATRALHAAGDEHSMIKRGRWWTRGGSTRMVFDEAALESVVTYVMECQDRGRGV